MRANFPKEGKLRRKRREDSVLGGSSLSVISWQGKFSSGIDYNNCADKKGIDCFMSASKHEACLQED